MLTQQMQIPTIIDATNVSILAPVFGRLPESKAEILDRLRNMLAQQGEEVLRYRRTHLRGL